MKIKKTTYQSGNDFKWIGECEHCGYLTGEIWGYHDANYFGKVIPSIICKECDKSTTDEFKGVVTVEKH